MHRCEGQLKTRCPLGIADRQTPRSGRPLAISGQFPYDLATVRAGRIVIRQLGSLNVGNDSPTVVQVEEITWHRTPSPYYTQPTGPTAAATRLPF